MSAAAIFTHWLCICDQRRNPLPFYGKIVAILNTQEVYHWRHLADVDVACCGSCLSPRSRGVIARHCERCASAQCPPRCAQGCQRSKGPGGTARSRRLFIRAEQALQWL